MPTFADNLQVPIRSMAPYAGSLEAPERASAEATPPPAGARRLALGLERIPFVRPIFDRGIEKHLLEGVIRRRLIPLCSQIIEAQSKIRGARAETMAERARQLKAKLLKLDRSTIASAGRLFEAATDVSKDLEAIIDDADYLSFHRLSTLTQLRAAAIAMRSSKALWTTLHVADAFRAKDLRQEASALIFSSDELARRADRGLDVKKDLEALERRYETFARHLDEQAGVPSGAQDGVKVFAAGLKIWDYRMAIQDAVLLRTKKTGPLSTAELVRELRQDGFPPEVIAKILEEDVVQNLLAFASSEGAGRNDTARHLQARAQKLAEEIRAVSPEELADVDRFERLVQHVGAELDAILAGAEKVVDPIDGPVRKLRAANDALRTFRGLFTALRLRDALLDPEFRSKAQALGETIAAGGASKAEDGDLDGRLGVIESALQDFGKDLERRLKIDAPPSFIAKSTDALQKARRVVRASDALEKALTPEVQAALDALTDLEMSPEERARIYDRAAGAPLREAVVGVLKAMHEVDLGFNFRELGRSVNAILRLGGEDGDLNPTLARSPLAFLGQANFEDALASFDAFFAKVDTEEGRARIERVLNVLRAAGLVERDNLVRVAFRIPEEERIKVAGAISSYAAELSILALQWVGQGLQNPGGEAVADFLDAMITTTEKHLDSLLTEDPAAIRPDHVNQVSSTMGQEAKDSAVVVGTSRIPSFIQELSKGDLDETRIRRIMEVNEKLVEALEVVETTDDSRAALRAVFSDVAASLRLMVHFVHLFGAASNDLMDPNERARAIRGSVEKMGPLFVKMMQTIVNMQDVLVGLASKANQDTKTADPIVEALKSLQDEVTPLPWSVIEKQIESSLGKPVHEAFLWIDEQPLKSGSMGQTHRAKIEVENHGKKEIVDVVVKVLRPGLDHDFEDTIRVTELTLSVFRELLRLDKDGSIFGPMKEVAESKLPMLERALPAFMDSFRVEMDFGQEADNMKRFKRLLGADRYVAVPEVYDSHTQGNVLTMEELKGFKLSPWLERYDRARAAEAPPEEMGPLDPVRPEKDAVVRATRWIEGCTGQDVRTAKVLGERHGWIRVGVEMSARTGSGAGTETAEILVRKKSGEIRPRRDLPSLDRRATEGRLALWAQKKFGLPVRQVIAEHHHERRLLRSKDGFMATIVFDDPKQKSAQVFVDRKSGTIEPVSVVPDLSEQGIAGLRDRLLSTLINQGLRRCLHGDPHQGNFFILPDGKTIGLMDYGLAIKLGLHSASGPLFLLSGALLGEPKKMAEALFSMANLPLGLSERTRSKIKADLEAECRAVIEQIRDKAKDHPAKGWKEKLVSVFQRTQAAMLKSADVMLNKVGLAPMPVYLQMLKATFSMAGNIADVEKHAFEKSAWKTRLRIAGDFFLYQAMAPLFGWIMAGSKAKHIERISVLDVRALQAGGDVSGSSRSPSSARTSGPSAPLPAR